MIYDYFRCTQTKLIKTTSPHYLHLPQIKQFEIFFNALEILDKCK